MKRTTTWKFVLTCLLGLLWVVPVAHAQLKLAAQQLSLTTTAVTPADTTVQETNRSPEIMAIDVPAMPSSGYVLINTAAIWNVSTTADAPVRALLLMRFDISSPAFTDGIHLALAIPLTNFRHSNNGSGQSLEGGSASVTEVLTRDAFAGFLQQVNTIDPDTAAQIADELFKQGFHVSVSEQLTSVNITGARLTNPSVAFFAESGSK